MIFLTGSNFLKGDTNIYFKQIIFFGKKRFCKNHTYFFLKNIFLFKLSFAMELLHGFATFEQPYQRCSMKKGVLRSFRKFTGNHLCQILFFNKVAGLRSAK